MPRLPHREPPKKEDNRLRKEVAQQLEDAFVYAGISKNEAGKRGQMGTWHYEYLAGRKTVVPKTLLTLAEVLGCQIHITITPKDGGK